MDLLASQCKKKLETFRIKELKDVLSRIGAAKQGKKQALIDKIMAVILLQDSQQLNPMVAGLKLENFSTRHSLNREKVAKVIDEIYRVRQFGAPDLATAIGNIRHGSCDEPQLCEAKDVKKNVESNHCPCGNPVASVNMIQCEDPSCLVWQHVNCVIPQEKEGMKPQIPTPFFCEICRVKHGDPFCVSVAHPLLPTKTTTSFLYAAEGGIMQNLGATFILNRSQRELLQSPGYDLQVWCVLLGDEVAFRMHWPLKADLRVNGDSVRVTNRPGQQKLGLNGRDDGPVINDYVREGINRISLSAYDGRSFCLGVRVIQRLTVDQVFSHIPSEEHGESFDVALSRVRRCVVGCTATDDDSDSDLEIVSESVTVNLRCPMSGSRIKMAGRFKPCMHMGCFDLRTFIELNQRARKWQCPICLKNYTLNDLIIDPIFNRIAQALKGYGEDVTEIEMKPDGHWRPKPEGDLNPEFWRSPDGIITSVNKFSGSPEILSTVKIEEGLSNDLLSFKMKLKRTRDETHVRVGMHVENEVIDNHLIYRQDHIDNCVQSQNSTATGSNGNSSVNQELAGPQIGFRRSELEVSSIPAELPKTGSFSGLLSNDLDQPKFLDVIVLSDTEEDSQHDFNVECRTGFVSDGNVNEGTACQGSFDLQSASGIIPSTDFGTFLGNSSVPLDFFSTGIGNSDHTSDSGTFWPTETRNAPFELFTSVPSVPIMTHNYQISHIEPLQSHGPVYSTTKEQTRINNNMYSECNLETQNFMGVDCQSQCREDMVGLASSDSSLRIFLPQQPARSADKPTMREPQVVPDEGLQEWFSLSLGTSGSLGDLSLTKTLSDQREPVDPVIDSGPVLVDYGYHITRRGEDICIQSMINRSTESQPANYSRNYFPDNPNF